MTTHTIPVYAEGTKGTYRGRNVTVVAGNAPILEWEGPGDVWPFIVVEYEEGRKTGKRISIRATDMGKR